MGFGGRRRFFVIVVLSERQATDLQNVINMSIPQFDFYYEVREQHGLVFLLEIVQVHPAPAASRPFLTVVALLARF